MCLFLFVLIVQFLFVSEAQLGARIVGRRKWRDCEEQFRLLRKMRHDRHRMGRLAYRTAADCPVDRARLTLQSVTWLTDIRPAESTRSDRRVTNPRH